MFIGSIRPSHAQEADSLRSYNLGEIVIDAADAPSREVSTVQRVSLREIERQNAAAVSDLARTIPAAFVQTNSRGESLIYLRDAGERQVALFLNGASLNVPWDNRFNLDMMPAAMIGGLSVAKGIPSVLYGTNVLGGAINLTARRREDEGRETTLSGYYGGVDELRLDIRHLRKDGPLHIGVAGGYATRNGIALADPSLAPFSQAAVRTRTNTDRELLNLFGQTDYRFKNGIQAGLTLMHVEGQFGVAPEGHLDPDSSTVRFWRYPNWHNTMSIANATFPLGEATVFKGSAWVGVFGQSIDQFDSAEYRQVDTRQRDDDRTFGGRFSVLRGLGKHQLTFSATGYTSVHDELVRTRGDNGQFASEAGTLTFGQQVFSAGGELSLVPSPAASVTVGISLDGVAMPRTGDKPARDPILDYAFLVGSTYRFDEHWALRGSVGRKIRFPTMRELFGEALNRFLLNPDLLPETSIVVEGAVARDGPAMELELIGFRYRVFDTIDQRNVVVDGRRLRQRINLDGSWILGGEAILRWQVSAPLEIEGNLSALNVRGILDGTRTRLTEKPEVLGMLAAVYRMKGGVEIGIQGEYTGRAYGRRENDTLAALPTALAFDARVGYAVRLRTVLAPRLEFYLRGDNLTDAQILPQLGLPSPGRSLGFGAGITF
jgi:iron complex outermembrane receptor protein